MKEVKKGNIYCAVVLSAIVAIAFIAFVISTLINVSNEVEDLKMEKHNGQIVAR